VRLERLQGQGAGHAEHERDIETVKESNELKDQDRVVERGSALRDRAIDAAERARQTVSQTPTDRWAQLAAAGVALVVTIVIVRRVRAS
jgi:hypothetical protein